VNVAMPHLRGKWSPTNAILRILESSSMRQSLHSSRPALLCTRVCAPTANVPPQRELGKDPGSVDSVLRAVVFKACGSTDPMRVGRSARRIFRADAVIVSMSPTKLSLGMVASRQSPLPFHPAKSLYLAS
jgi:hypothetical protein